MITEFTYNAIKIFVLAAFSAIFSFSLVRPLLKILRKHSFWKKEARQKAISGEEAKIFYAFHKERETSVPRGGGVLIWITVLIIIFFFYFLSRFSDIWWLKKLNFLSRRETWLPLFSLAAGSIVGLIDDFCTVNKKGRYIGGGLGFFRRLIIVLLIGLVGGLWFYYKLDRETIHIPLLHNFPEGFDWNIGIFYIPLFVLVTAACWATGVVDGLDGLAGGTFLAIFGSFTVIAFSQGLADLSAFMAVIMGALFAFLWFNIPPAKFYMGETGILGLTVTLAVITFLTDSVFVLPIIGGILVIEAGSVILQLLSKKFFKKKIWLSTPIHHHLEARGWPPYQITMRFWILGVLFALIGVAIRLLG